MNVMEIEDKYSIAGFKKRPIVINKGEDAILWDSEGKEYIDCVGGQGVANIGHCVKEITQALTEQSKQLIICPALFYNDVRAELYKKLASLVPSLNRSFLCNSGAEAVEGALKFARVTTGKKEVIAAVNSFHGRTFGALSATWKKAYREPFAPLVEGFKHVSYNKIDALKEAITDNTAAIILEVVQGEGGVILADEEYLRQVRELCNEKDIILIFDEVQTGFGRTGKMFACEHYGIEPDIMTVAKSIAGGLPMGAVLCNGKINVPDKLHANTFGGYPLTCAAALAAIKFIEDNNLVENSAKLGEYFINKLKQIDSNKIREIRGLGLMTGIELKEKPGATLKRLMELGILALPAGATVVRYLPPLVISKEQIDVVVEKTVESLTN